MANLLTISEYSALAGLHRAAVYQRIKAGTLPFTKVKHKNAHIILIDADAHPPARRKAGRPPYRHGQVLK